MKLKNLQAIHFLQGVDEDILVELTSHMIWQEYAPGAIIFLEEEAASAIYCLQYGWVKVVKNSLDGREQILRVFGPNEVFNELCVFANKANPATAIALEAVGAWLIPRIAMQQLLASHPQVSLSVIEHIADRVIHLVSLVADISLHSVEVRVARMILEASEGNVMHRRGWATQTELAAQLGTVPDVLSRVLRGLVGSGIIEMNRQEIRILKREELEALSMTED